MVVTQLKAVAIPTFLVAVGALAAGASGVALQGGGQPANKPTALSAESRARVNPSESKAESSSEKPSPAAGAAGGGERGFGGGESGFGGGGGGGGGFGVGGGGGFGGGGATDQPSAEQYRLQIARTSALLSTLDKSPMNQDVLKALEDPITLQSTEKSTLGLMLKQIKDSVRTAEGKKIPIYVDPVALQEEGKTLDAPVVIDLEEVPLKFSLRLMLKQVGLAYCVRDGVLIISSLEGVQQELMEAQSEQMGLNPDKFPMMGGMGGMGGGFGGMGGGQGMGMR